MSSPVISVENVSKQYLLGHRVKREPYQTLSDVFGREFRNFGRKVADIARGRQIVQGDNIEEFWALKNVSFEVKEGEVLGIIGRNGAGKSTLLKILSRITEPTSGRVSIRGRVASLLEVGTGFHPELSGRENIYLNGAILGMSRAEIRRKFDEIVAFAEVEKFLDTPVKRYSSGMYVRLAFGVAAHLEPEILIVDEVLAVGDTEFQKKCLGKMDDISRREGRTVLFVSHNLAAVGSLCSRGIYLVDGKVLVNGSVEQAIATYSSPSQGNAGEWHLPLTDLKSRAKDRFFFTAISIVNKEGSVISSVDAAESFQLRIEFETLFSERGAELYVQVERTDGVRVFTSERSISQLSSGASRSACCVEIPAMFLMPGEYFLTVAAHIPNVEWLDKREHVLQFEVMDTGTNLAKYRNYKAFGVVMVDLPWRVLAHA